MELVYKYLPPERHTFLSDGLLRITQPGDLNDPFECLSVFPDIDPSKEVEDAADRIRSRLFSNSNPDLQLLAEISLKTQIGLAKASHPSAKGDFIRKYCEGFIKGPNRDIGIVSFSKIWNSSTMWAHYAEGHCGYCLGFDRNDLFFYRTDPYVQTGRLRDVDYLQKRIPCKVMEGEKPGGHTVLFCKSEDWRYEHEVRVVYSQNDATTCLPGSSNRKFPIHLKRFPIKAVKEIILGYNASAHLRQQVLAFAKSHEIQAFKMQLSTTTDFAMEREQIS